MSTYILIHGAWHGAWCWDKVIPFLEKEGHTVITPDLPAHGNDKTPISEVTLQTYADRVCDVVNAQTEKIILVGHSMGGIAITQAAEHCSDKIQKLVYITAFLLQNGEFLVQYAQDDREALVMPNLVMAEDGSCSTLKDEAVKQAFYEDCSDEDIIWAKKNLVPQPAAPFVTPLSTTDENFGKIPRVYIECLQDKAISPSFQKKMYTNLSCEKVFSMNTSHSPFLSAPEELANILLSL
ncbi:alpha/beta fold hydrolase [Bacteroidota bacterium]